MPAFLGLAIQTDVRCASGATVAVFPPQDLVACSAVLSPIEPESLTFIIPRSDPRAAECTPGRVVRTRFTGGTLDREWDIVALGDDSNDDQLSVTAQPIALRLARVIYKGANSITGAPEFAFSDAAAAVTAVIDNRILPAATAAGLTWIERGTVDSSAVVDLAGEWASAAEIAVALADPGRANGEWQLRRDGDTRYLLDLVNAIGSSAPVLRVRTALNLLEDRRKRDIYEAATRLYPRGSVDGEERTIAAHLWRVKTVVDGTWLELEDIQGGAGPIAYDDQLNGLYLAVMNSYTFASQAVADSVAATQRVQVASTAGISVGEWCRFFVGSGENGARVSSLRRPLAAVAPSAGGLGDRALILDRPALRGDCNLVPNPSMRVYTSPTAAPDGWTVNAGTPANRTIAREATIIRDSPYTCRLTTTGVTTLSIETADIPVWAIAGRRHFGAIWFNLQAVPADLASALIFELITSGGTVITELGRWVRGSDGDVAVDSWIRFAPDVVNLEAVTSAVRLRVRVAATNSVDAASGWDVVFGPALLAEAEVPIQDIDYSGGTHLWQEANRALANVSSAIRGYDLGVLDLERDDAAYFADYAFTPGGTIEVTDTDLGEVVSQRLLEYRPDYLNPLQAQIRVGVPAPDIAKDVGSSPITPPRERPDGGVAMDSPQVVSTCEAALGTVGASTVVVTVTATSPLGTPDVRLVALTGSASINTGAAIGVIVPAGSSWTFNLGAFGTGPSQAVFEAVLNGTRGASATIEIPEKSFIQYWTAVQVTITATTYSFAWRGGPGDVHVDVGGASGFTDLVPSNPYVVSRQAFNGGEDIPVMFYPALALGSPPDGASSFVVLRQDPSIPDPPAIHTGAFTAGDTPGDGSGSVEVTWSWSNLPSGGYFDITLTTVAGDPITAVSGGDTGLTASPETINMALGNGARLHCLIEMFNSSAVLVAQREFTADVP